MTEETTPKVKNKWFLRILFGGTTVLGILISLVTTVIGWWAMEAYTTPGLLDEQTTVVIKPGSSSQAILEKLTDAGVIDNLLATRIALYITGDGKTMQAGEYAFQPGISPATAIDILSSGKRVTRKFTAAEGLSVHQILQSLKDAEGLSGSIEGNYSEGMLLPETYHYHYGDNRSALVERMHQAMRKEIRTLWKNRQPNLPLKNPIEALTLASIVEKETGVAAERSRVAAVFINRLRKGMPLQSDPTTIYALTEGKTELGRPLTRKDLKVESPYNTYHVNGLPPGPIACPGKESLHAVLNPDITDELYFVATGNGGHAFAKTLKEHNRNVQAYRRALRRQQ